MTTISEVHPLPVQSDSWLPPMTDVRSCESASMVAARHKIMVVDDTPINLKVICAYLAREGYKQIEAVQESREAVAVLFREDPDLLILDLMMPHVSGLDILKQIRGIPRFHRLPVIVITAAEEREMKTESLKLGATDFLLKPIEADDLILRARNALELKYYQDSLEEKVLQRTAELIKSQEDIVHCLARAAEYRDNETGNHVIRVSRYVSLMASRLKMDARMIHLLELASTLHDMGKIGIPDSILGKPGSLTDEERTLMKDHSKFGAEICMPTRKKEQESFSTHVVVGAMMLNGCTSPLLQMASRIALTHHERWDGAGYPRGLKGEDIPIEGRITAVADVFDALSSKRPYKPAFPLDKCFGIIEEEAGKHFDPRIAQVFLSRKDDVVAVYNTLRDE